MDWRYAQDNLLLVRRDLYEIYSLMTEAEFRRTEPFVEAIALLTPKDVIHLQRHDTEEEERYYAETDGGPLVFSLPHRQQFDEDQELADRD